MISLRHFEIICIFYTFRRIQCVCLCVFLFFYSWLFLQWGYAWFKWNGASFFIIFYWDCLLYLDHFPVSGRWSQCARTRALCLVIITSNHTKNVWLNLYSHKFVFIFNLCSVHSHATKVLLVSVNNRREWQIQMRFDLIIFHRGKVFPHDWQSLQIMHWKWGVPL